MASGNDERLTQLTPEQRERLAAELSPALKQFAVEWQAQFEPLLSQLHEPLAIGNPVFDQVVQRMKAKFDRIQIPVLDLLTIEFPKIDLTALMVNFPSNLRADTDDLEHLARIALKDGIPIAWVPRAEILPKLLQSANTADRYELLVQHCGDILDDCDTALENREGLWVNAAREAISSAHRGDFGVAQSHAANLIDSILLTEFADPEHRHNTRQTRTNAKSLARRAVSLEDTLNQLGRHLAVRPIPSAFAQWYPGDPPPTAFNRHATAHCVGHPDVFSEAFCLIAVMLATSLVRQFGS